MADKVERLTNLVALLMEAREPLSFRRIRTELPGQYPQGLAAARGAFERDKTLLRAEGIPIEQEVLTGTDAGQTGYWINRRRYELGDLGLSEDERRALQVAVAAVHQGTEWAREAMWKVGPGGDDVGRGESGDDALDEAGVALSLPASPALPSLYAAAVERSTVEFGYHGRPRRLDPYGLLARDGFWYVVGHDQDAGSRRTYRVDRIEGAVVAVAGAPPFERPDDFDARSAFPTDPKLIGADAGPARLATVRVAAVRAAAVRRELGQAAVADEHPDGAVTVVVPCANITAFRSWVLGLLEHSVVLGPPDARGAVTDWLAALAGRAP